MLSTIFSILMQFHEGLLLGLGVTVQLCGIIWGIGILGGALLGVVATRDPDLTGRLLKIVSFLLASIPVIVLLFWLHYPFQEMLGVVITPFITAAIALTFVNMIKISQIFRDVLSEFPKEYRIAGKVCGLSDWQIVIYIEFPIIFRQVIPQLLTQSVNMLQMTLFASLISVDEIFRAVQRINSVIYKPVEIYSALALFFIMVCLPMTLLAHWLKTRFTRNFSEK